MKACTGFVLRNITGEYLLMPTGDRIAAFHGAVWMNELSAFVWEKLQTSMTYGELLEQILNVYEIDEITAAADLDALLADLKSLGVIEE